VMGSPPGGADADLRAEVVADMARASC
jgi:hypothetical protein